MSNNITLYFNDVDDSIKLEDAEKIKNFKDGMEWDPGDDAGITINLETKDGKKFFVKDQDLPLGGSSKHIFNEHGQKVDTSTHKIHPASLRKLNMAVRTFITEYKTGKKLEEVATPLFD